MLCERCHVEMVERPSVRQPEDRNRKHEILLECPQCRHSEYQPLIASFWRRLAA